MDGTLRTYENYKHYRKKLSISFEIDEIIGINTVKKLINLTKKKKSYVMSSLYKIFLKNIKKSPKKIFIYTEKKILMEIHASKK